MKLFRFFKKQCAPKARGSLQAVDGRILRETIEGLKAVKLALDTFLAKGREQARRGMWEVSPGIWISNDFKTLNEALSWLRTVLWGDSSIGGGERRRE